MRVHLRVAARFRDQAQLEKGWRGKDAPKKSFLFRSWSLTLGGYEIHENIRGALVWVKIMQTTNLKWKEFLLHTQKKASIPYFSTFPRLYPPRIIQVMWHSPTRPLCPQVHQSSLSLHLRVPHPPHMKCTRHTAWDQEKEHWEAFLLIQNSNVRCLHLCKLAEKKMFVKLLFLGDCIFSRASCCLQGESFSMVGKVGYNTVAIPVPSEFLITNILSVDFPGVSACRSAKTSPVVQYGS